MGVYNLPFYSDRYAIQGIDINSKYLNALTTKVGKKSESKYDKISNPIMSKSLYVEYCIYQAITQDIAEKTLQNIQPLDYQNSIIFFETYPPELRLKYQKLIWSTKPEGRVHVWEKLKVPYKKIQSAFLNIVNQRNRIALKNDNQSSLDYYLKVYRIPPDDYKNFIENVDNIINLCNIHLTNFDKLTPNSFYGEFNNPCYVCLLDDFPFKTIDDVIEYVYKNNPLLNEYRQQIDITIEANSSSTYDKNDNRFKIKIDQAANIRHQAIDLIHEFSHIINRLSLYKLGILPEEQGVFLNECKTLSIEMSFYKELSKSLYDAIFGEFLKTFHRVLFEIQLYQNPDQDLSQLYANTFNKCYPKASLSTNRAYILDNLIIENPFATLPHALAQAQFILDQSTQ